MQRTVGNVIYLVLLGKEDQNGERATQLMAGIVWKGQCLLGGGWSDEESDIIDGPYCEKAALAAASAAAALVLMMMMTAIMGRRMMEGLKLSRAIPMASIGF